MSSASRQYGPDRFVQVSVGLVVAQLCSPPLQLQPANPAPMGPDGRRTNATPPAIRLRYDLRRAGRRIAGGEERLTDINFLFGARAAAAGGTARAAVDDMGLPFVRAVRARHGDGGEGIRRCWPKGLELSLAVWGFGLLGPSRGGKKSCCIFCDS